MTDEPIFDRLEETWHGVISHGRQDIEGVRKVWDRLAHRIDVAANPAAAPTGKANGMATLQEIADRLRADAEARIAAAKEYLEQHAQVVEEFAAGLSSNPLMAAAPSLVHLSADTLSGVANALLDAEAKAAAAHQAAADAQAAQDAALAAAQPPADAPAEGDAAPADPPA